MFKEVSISVNVDVSPNWTKAQSSITLLKYHNNVQPPLLYSGNTNCWFYFLEIDRRSLTKLRISRNFWRNIKHSLLNCILVIFALLVPFSRYPIPATEWIDILSILVKGLQLHPANLQYYNVHCYTLPASNLTTPAFISAYLTGGCDRGL